jgi:hypothetical protein
MDADPRANDVHYRSKHEVWVQSLIPHVDHLRSHDQGLVVSAAEPFHFTIVVVRATAWKEADAAPPINTAALNAYARHRGRPLRGQVGKNVLDRDLALSLTALHPCVQPNAAEQCEYRKDGRLVSC